jgi:hypothetical protein
MNLNSTFEQIESLEFMSHFAVISGIEIFRLALSANPLIESLVKELKGHPKKRAEVYDHVIALLDVEGNPQYYHPQDIAIASYLYVLSRVNRELADKAVERTLNTPRLRWAERIARAISETEAYPSNL